VIGLKSNVSGWLVPHIGNLVLQFITDNAMFMQGILDNESLLFVQLDRLIYEIFLIYGKAISASKFSIQQYAQVYQNSNLIQEMVPCFKKYLEKMTNNKYQQESEAMNYFEQIKYSCLELINEETRNKIGTYMYYYETCDWKPHNVQSTHTDCVEDLMNFLLSLFTTLNQINGDIVPSLCYLSFKHINYLYMMALQNTVKEFNMLGIVNLEYDIVYMFAMCGSIFKEYENLRECLREIRQFMDLFTNGHVNDLLNLQERTKKYYALNIKTVIPILEKYKRRKLTSTKVPFLKRGQVKDVVSKLKKELKLK